MEKKFCRVKEGAERIGITERAMWAAIYRKQIEVKRWGRRVLIPIASLERFLDELTDEAA